MRTGRSCFLLHEILSTAPQSQGDFETYSQQNESTACAQPRKQDDEQKDDANQNANTCDENRLWNLADCFVELLRAFPSIIRIVEVADSATTRTKVCKLGSETDYEPFLQSERLKQDILHQFEGLAERLEDFDF